MSSKKERQQIHTERSILEYRDPLDYDRMMEYLEIMIGRYPQLSISYIGESILGRGIPMLSLGEGEKTVLYVGAHHGMEWITSVLLLRFVNELCELWKSNGRIFEYSVKYLLSSRTLLIVPMLNPDGVDYQINGVGEDHVLYDRLLSMNGGSRDFSEWQANARGVDLNHNYNSGFAEYKAVEAEMGIFGGAPTKYSGECPESEPEVGALCNYIRYNDRLRMILTLHTQGEEIYYTGRDGKVPPRSKAIAEAFRGMSGYALRQPTGSAAYGGLTDWCVEELNLPSFTLECGKGKNPLPLEDYFYIYARIRKLLFLASTVI